MRAILYAAACLVCAAVSGAAQPLTPRTEAELRESYARHAGDFDYLLGDWRFSAESAEWGRFGGYWSAVRIATGNVAQILDEYRIVGDSGETYFASVTLRSYNAHLDRWELVSASEGTGLQDIGTARRVGDEMHIEQTFRGATATPELWRIRYYDIGADRFSWVADRSLDGGRSWVRNHLRIEARRIGPARDLDALVGIPRRVGGSTPQ